MNILTTKQLTDSQTEGLINLVALCRAHDGFHLSCPLDADRFYLLEAQKAAGKTAASEGTIGGNALEGALAVFEADGVWECYAFTRPDLRRTHCFLRLLDRLERDAGEQEPEPELCFVADPSCAAAQKTLAAIGAQLWYEEHAMIWNADASPAPPQLSGGASPVSLEFTSQGLPVRFPPRSGEPASLPERLDILARARDGQPVGTCSLYLQPPSACLFEVEIRTPFRGRGLGEATVRTLQQLAPGMGLSSLTLQVSGDNIPAVQLYKKTGFHITETLSYYLY